MANEIVALIDKNRPALQALLQGNSALSPDRLISLFWGDLRRSRALAQCTPESLIRALLQCAAVGVEANTPLQHACIIPRKGVAQFQMMFRGLMYLGVMHGSVVDWRAEAVYTMDKFEYRPASPTEPIVHAPYLDAGRGVLRGAYSLVFLPNGMARAKWMPIEEIREIRDKYSESWKAGHTGPWKDREGEMGIKTVVINHAKQIRMAGPPPVTVGEVVYERGPAAMGSFDDDFDDGELPAEDKPRAKEKAQSQEKVLSSNNPPVAETERPDGRTRHAAGNASSAPKLVLTPDEPRSEGHGAAGDPPTANTSSALETPLAPDEDRQLTETEGEQLLNECKRIGLTLAQRGQLLERFHIDSYENLMQSQVPAFVAAMRELKK